MDEQTKQSMGELAALMYQDTKFMVREGESLPDAMTRYTEERFPGTQARMAAQRVASQAEAAVKKEREEFRAEMEKEKAARVRQAAIDEIKADPALRIRDDEIPAVEKVMAERFIGTYRDAARLHRADTQVAAPRRSSLSMDMPGMGVPEGDPLAWLRPAWANRDGAVLDRVTRGEVNRILDDYDRDPIAAERKYNS